jgi:quercetin dioxygenase-like cupin family protein
MFEKTETPVPIIALVNEESGVVRVVDGRSRVLVRSEQVNGAYSILEQEIPAGKGPPLHVHRHETEVFYVISGEFEFRIGDDVLVGGPGTNAVCADSDEAARVYRALSAHRSDLMPPTILI